MNRLSEMVLEDTATRRLLRGDDEEIGPASHRESWPSAPYRSLMRWGCRPPQPPPAGAFCLSRRSWKRSLVQPKYLSYSISLYITKTTIYKYSVQFFSVYKNKIFTCGFIIYSYNIDGVVESPIYCVASVFQTLGILHVLPRPTKHHRAFLSR